MSLDRYKHCTAGQNLQSTSRSNKPVSAKAAGDPKDKTIANGVGKRWELFISQWLSDAVILICEYGFTPFKVKPIKYPCNSFGIFNNKEWNNEWITVVEVVVVIIIIVSIVIIIVVIINFYLNYYSIEYIQNYLFWLIIIIVNYN